MNEEFQNKLKKSEASELFNISRNRFALHLCYANALQIYKNGMLPGEITRQGELPTQVLPQHGTAWIADDF
jgi:hypothetical protein